MPGGLARLAVSACALALCAPSVAVAEQPLVPLLTGGKLSSQGTVVLTHDQTGTDRRFDPPSPDECDGQQCQNTSTIDYHRKMDGAFDTAWLVDGRYPGVPADPNASPNAFRWVEDFGTWHYFRKVVSTNYPNSQGDGGGPDDVTTNTCDTPVYTRAVPGTEVPLVGLGDEGFFDPATSRKLLLNAYGSSLNEPICGPTNNYGFWAILGIVPSEGETLEWDLGDAPPETASVVKNALWDKTTPCDDLFTDGTPNDTESCSERSRIVAANKLECALCVTDIKYEHHDGGTSSWTEVPDEGTWDGNEVRITAVIENRHEKSLSVPVLLRDKESKRRLEGTPANERTVDFPAGAATKVEFIWRTDGWAWEKNEPRSERDIQLLTPYGGAQQNIVVRPRPVVLVHGWNSDASTWGSYAGLLKAIHPLWRPYAVGDGQVGGRMNTDPTNGASIVENAQSEHNYVENLRQKLDADHVDLVAHSMGGLISRQYIHTFMKQAVDGRPVARRLVMLGTPNMGSPCADLIGVFARGIPTQQLRPAFAQAFNATVTNRKGVAFSIMAGDVNLDTCQSDESGDTVVEVSSAWWTLADRAKTYVLHTSMPGSAHLVESFVRPRLALDPDGVKKIAAGRPLARPVAGASKASAGPVALGSFSARLSGSRVIRAAFPAGAKASFAFLADPGVGAELIAPNGKKVAEQKPNSMAAQAAIRYIAAPKPAKGTWRLRLRGKGSALGAPFAVGGKDRLLANAKQSRTGRIAISAKVVRGGRPSSGATVRATLASVTGRTAKLNLKGRGRGRYAATTKKLQRGTWFVVVTARDRRGRLLASAQTR